MKDLTEYAIYFNRYIDEIKVTFIPAHEQPLICTDLEVNFLIRSFAPPVLKYSLTIHSPNRDTLRRPIWSSYGIFDFRLDNHRIYHSGFLDIVIGEGNTCLPMRDRLFDISFIHMYIPTDTSTEEKRIITL